jgi:hypothetical protein
MTFNLWAYQAKLILDYLGQAHNYDEHRFMLEKQIAEWLEATEGERYYPQTPPNWKAENH